VYTLWV